MLPDVQYGRLVLQSAETTFSTAETKLKKRLSKKQGIFDKLQQYSQNPADLKIESTKKNRNWIRKPPIVCFFSHLS